MLHRILSSAWPAGRDRLRKRQSSRMAQYPGSEDCWKKILGEVPSIRVFLFALALVSAQIATSSSTAEPAAVPADFEISSPEVGDADDEDHFGSVVAMSGDIALVGVPLDDIGRVSAAGSVYAFRLQNGVWIREGKIISSELRQGATFGEAIAVNASVIAVGSPDSYPDGIGEIELFEHESTGWVTRGRVQRTSVLPVGFGLVIAISDDFVVAGTPEKSNGHGGVEVYRRSAGQLEYAYSIDSPQAAGAHQRFGQSLAFSGTELLVSEPGSLGHVHRYQLGVGAATSLGEVPIGPSGVSGAFGKAVATSGEFIAIAGNSTSPGQTSVFVYAMTTSGPSYLRTLNVLSSSSLAFAGSWLVVGERFFGGNPLAGRISVAHCVNADCVPAVTFEQPSSATGFGGPIGGNEHFLLAGIPDRGSGSVASYSLAPPWNSPPQFDAGNARGPGFGSFLALDQGWLAVASRERTGGQAGAVLLYQRSPAGWAFAQKFVAPPDSVFYYGAGLAIGGDTIMFSEFGTTNRIRVYRKTDVWTHEATLPIRPFISESNIDIQGDVAVIGSAEGPAGTVHVLKHLAGGWVETQVLQGRDAQIDGSFGTSVSMDGNLLAVGHPGQGVYRGRVYVYQRGDDGLFVEVVTLDGIADQHRFGQFVSLAGNRLAVVASSRNGYGVTTVYENQGANWVPVSEMTPQGLNSVGRVRLGLDRVFVTEFGDRGHVRMFRNSGATWNEGPELTAPSLDNLDEFGTSVAISGREVAVGAPARFGTGPYGNPYEGRAFTWQDPAALLTDGFE